MRIHTLAIAAFMLAAPATSMAANNGTTDHLDGRTAFTTLEQIKPGGPAEKEINRFAPVSRYWRCPRRRGMRVTHMTFRRGRSPLCHYKRLGYRGHGWRATRAAWRHCRRKYGRRVIRALESRTQYRCIYRRHRA
jgi:hypothetical protein